MADKDINIQVSDLQDHAEKTMGALFGAAVRPKILSYRPSPGVDKLIREHAAADGQSVQRSIEQLVILGLLEEGMLDGASESTWDLVLDLVNQNFKTAGEIFEWAANEARTRRAAGEPGLTWYDVQLRHIRNVEAGRLMTAICEREPDADPNEVMSRIKTHKDIAVEVPQYRERVIAEKVELASLVIQASKDAEAEGRTLTDEDVRNLVDGWSKS